jgi:hypothetical protein
MRTSSWISSKGAIASVVLGAIASFGTSTVMAQELQISPATEAANFSGKTIPEETERAYFEHDSDFLENRKIHRQISYLLGPGLLISNSFPENEIARDAKELFAVYNTIMASQMAAGPRIRTVDHPNPFNLSLRTLPAYVNVGPLPSTPMPRLPIVPAPTPGPITDNSPIPALW